MRWPLILVSSLMLWAGLFAGCDSSSHASKREQRSTRASSGKPPVISEGFTLLSCPAKPKTTLDFEGCAEHKIVRTDEAINLRAKRLFVLLGSRHGGAARDRFVRGERAWLTYRRSVCESRADVYEGGSEANVVFAGCEARRNAAHLRDLRAFLRDLRH